MGTAKYDDLMRAILEDPSDDASRSMLADYLQERDDPRGEFIAVQLALAALPPQRPVVFLTEFQFHNRRTFDESGKPAEEVTVEGLVPSVWLLPAGVGNSPPGPLYQHPSVALRWNADGVVWEAPFAVPQAGEIWVLGGAARVRFRLAPVLDGDMVVFFRTAPEPTEDDRRHEALLRRERELFPGDRLYWGRGDYDYVTVTPDCFRRGLVEHVDIQNLAWFEAHAKELFLAAPLTSVRLRDRAANYEASTGRSWWSRRARERDDLPWWLPRDLFSSLTGGLGCWPSDDTNHPYPSGSAALAALSAACVTWGRQLAGLPALP